ncbi:hypothetical protein B4113_3054 [Geobacillus sp. B4113_201601]|nr:hypothetical protein B4113_3054 [Geobacillus sp. B4113_201601]
MNIFANISGDEGRCSSKRLYKKEMRGKAISVVCLCRPIDHFFGQE